MSCRQLPEVCRGPPLPRTVTTVYAIAIIRYRRPLDEIIAAQDEHRAYLRSLQAEGTLLAAGPMDPRTGGMLLLRVPDGNAAGALDRVRDGDPFSVHGLAQYELLAWKPVDRKSTRLNSSHVSESRMPSSA